MQLNIFKDYQTLSHHVAEAILETVKNNPTAVLCLATGDTPRFAYELMAKRGIAEKVDFTHCTFIGLDEWVGIPPQNKGSCRFFLESHIFKPLHIQASRVHAFDAMFEDPLLECSKIDKIIVEKGGIDLVLVGVGMNGHIGFNEPGVSPDKDAHVINLDETTQTVGQKYFPKAATLKQGITLGLRQVLQSRKLIMVANGTKKAEVIKKALEGEINVSMPASFIRNHPQGQTMIDEDAGALLNLRLVSNRMVVHHKSDIFQNNQ
ncbi:MAG: glucosamine-6-phosphate deaminase [Ferruginibacter sp.]